ncbi:MAG TPA: hypothetical protein P5049_04570 [Methanothrix sp.]|nr:hypothetical protein [Methanothrix sp.]
MFIHPSYSPKLQGGGAKHAPQLAAGCAAASLTLIVIAIDLTLTDKGQNVFHYQQAVSDAL